MERILVSLQKSAFAIVSGILLALTGVFHHGASAFVPLCQAYSAPDSPVYKNHFDSGMFSAPKPKRFCLRLNMYDPPAGVKCGIVPYYDYEEALAASQKLKKPVMLYFNGINSLYSRKMEFAAWSDQKVSEMLRDDFIVVYLFCDLYQVELPQDQQFFSLTRFKPVVNIGDKNADFLLEKFGSFSIPCYFFEDAYGIMLFPTGYSYSQDADKLKACLDSVKATFKLLHP